MLNSSKATRTIVVARVTLTVTACVFSSMQGRFSVIPSVFVTAAHYRLGLKRDAASVWIEDVTQSSFKVCLRELQNYAGSHDDVYTVSVYTFFTYQA